MMGNKEKTDQAEYDAFSRRARQVIRWGRGNGQAIKRAFWKRTRRQSAVATKAEAKRD